MTKKELAEKVAEKTGSTKKAAALAVDALFEAVTESLKAGEKVAITGFGTFDVKERGEHSAFNPRTGEKVQVAATRSPKFTAGKTLKETISK